MLVCARLTLGNRLKIDCQLATTYDFLRFLFKTLLKVVNFGPQSSKTFLTVQIDHLLINKPGIINTVMFKLLKLKIRLNKYE